MINALISLFADGERTKRNISFICTEHFVVFFHVYYLSKSRILYRNGDVGKQRGMRRGKENIRAKENVEREILFGDQESFLTFAL